MDKVDLVKENAALKLQVERLKKEIRSLQSAQASILKYIREEQKK